MDYSVLVARKDREEKKQNILHVREKQANIIKTQAKKRKRERDREMW